MDPRRWVGARAARPLVAGIAFALTALAYTAAYVRFVSPYGLFVISATVLVVSSTIGAFVAGVLVWRYAFSFAGTESLRVFALAGAVVGSLTLVLAGPLAVFGMMLPTMFVGGLEVSPVTPLLVAATLLSALAYGIVGTFIALVATLGTPVAVTAVVGACLGYLRTHYAPVPREAGSSVS